MMVNQTPAVAELGLAVSGGPASSVASLKVWTFFLSGPCCVSHATHCSVFAGICLTLYRSKLRLYKFWKQYKALFVIF